MQSPATIRERAPTFKDLLDAEARRLRMRVCAARS